MELRDALTQINAIANQVSRTETFRGYRPLTVSFTGVMALVAAALQPLMIAEPANNPTRFLQWWSAVAILNCSVVGLELALDCWRSPSHFARRLTWQAVEQFLPCIAAGGALTWSLATFAPESLYLLPGLWAIVFSLGVFSSLRQLPPALSAIGVHYLLTGLITIALARGEQSFSPWAMVGTFGIGQLLTAAILHFTQERPYG